MLYDESISKFSQLTESSSPSNSFWVRKNWQHKSTDTFVVYLIMRKLRIETNINVGYIFGGTVRGELFSMEGQRSCEHYRSTWFLCRGSINNSDKLCTNIRVIDHQQDVNAIRSVVIKMH